MRGQAGGHAARHVLHQRRVRDDEALAGARIRRSTCSAATGPCSSIALTLVSTGPLSRVEPVSGAGMRSCVGGPQPRGLYPSVDLRRADRSCGRAAPGSRAGPLRRRAGASRTSGAARAARRRPGAPRWRAHTRSRRRTSEVDSRRPDLERNSAALAVAVLQHRRARAPGSARPRAAPPRRPGRSASCGPCPRRAPPRRRTSTLVDVEVDELLGAQPAGVGDLEQGAVAQLQRRRGRDAVQQRGELRGRQHARELRRALGRRDEVGRVRGDLAVLAQRRGRARAAPPACAPSSPGAAPALGQAPRRSGAARAGSRRPASSSLRVAHAANWRGVDPVRAARALRHARGAAGRRRAGAGRAARTRLGCDVRVAVVLHRHGSRQVATLRQLLEAGVADEVYGPPRPWLRIQGPSDAIDHVVRGAAQAGAGHLHRRPGPSPLPAPCPAAAGRLGGGAGRGDRGPGVRRADRSDDVARASRPGPGRRASSTSGMRIRTQPWEARVPIELMLSVPWMPAPS